MRNFSGSNKKYRLKTFLSVIFWLAVWHIASLALEQEILLISPLLVLQKLTELVVQLSFWKSIIFSFIRVIGGFLIAVVLGIIMAVLAFKISFVNIPLRPLMSAIKATPVASYVILCLVFVSSKNLSALISFFMVLPVIYTNILQGLESVDVKLLEMADVFRMGFKNRIKYIYISQTIPYFLSAATVSLGLCWKAGIAAEVIGIPRGSIGERLHMAKIYLDMRELFAWTIVIIVVSFVFEKALLFGIKKLVAYFEGR